MLYVCVHLCGCVHTEACVYVCEYVWRVWVSLCVGISVYERVVMKMGGKERAQARLEHFVRLQLMLHTRSVLHRVRADKTHQHTNTHAHTHVTCTSERRGSQQSLDSTAVFVPQKQARAGQHDQRLKAHKHTYFTLYHSW